MDLKEILRLLSIVFTSLALTKAEPKHRPGRGRGAAWWAIAKAGEPDNLKPIFLDPAFNDNFKRKQRQLMVNNGGAYPALINAVTMAINECQHQFRNRRWNCSTISFKKGKNLFGKIIDKGCRETGFIYAIISAAVTHTIARACSEGSLELCTCDYSHQSKSPQANAQVGDVAGVREWEWGGCSDNIGFGVYFSREFVDAGERGRNWREKMNLHNNEAGRTLVQSEMRQECKCHGMSGSCTVKTCWMRLASFRVIGDKLKDRFDAASRIMITNSLHSSNSANDIGSISPNAVVVPSNSADRNIYDDDRLSIDDHPVRRRLNMPLPNSAPSLNSLPPHSGRGRQRNGRKHNKYAFQLKPHNPEHKPPGKKDIVYLDPSPSFCEKNLRQGVQGTHGRQCNNTSIGVDGCDLMCCGRGYRTQEVTLVERCACTFHWCCEVKCKTCQTMKTVHTCL